MIWAVSLYMYDTSHHARLRYDTRLASMVYEIIIIPCKPTYVVSFYTTGAVGLRWPGRSHSRAMSFERFRRCAQDTKAVKPRAMTHLALRP